MFRRIGNPSELTAQEQNAKITRAFRGDGGGFLKVPGLLTLLGVAVATATGRVQLQLSEDRLYMVHPDESVPRESENEELFKLDTTGYEVPVLMRSALSNHGIWQRGVEFFITGDWADDPTTPTGEKITAEEPKSDVPPVASTSKDDSFADDETFDSLPDELKANLRKFASLDAARNANNEEFNAVGIKGLDISRCRRALAKAVPHS